MSEINLFIPRRATMAFEYHVEWNWYATEDLINFAHIDAHNHLKPLYDSSPKEYVLNDPWNTRASVACRSEMEKILFGVGIPRGVADLIRHYKILLPRDTILFAREHPYLHPIIQTRHTATDFILGFTDSQWADLVADGFGVWEPRKKNQGNVWLDM